MSSLPAPPAPQPAATDRPPAGSPLLPSSRLFGNARTVFIDHAGQRYTLRITRENKLILTK